MTNFNKNIDISVVIPVFNGELFLNSCVSSVLNQTYKNIEVIIVNDGSTDDTERLIYEIQKQDNRVKYFYQSNQGQGAARNYGLKKANGKFVAFIDADDYIHPNFLSSLYYSINMHKADVAVSDWIYYYGNEKFNYTNSDKFMKDEVLKGSKVETLLASNIYFTVNKLYNKEFLLSNKIFYGEGYIYEDFEFYISAFTRANVICTIPNPYYYVRINRYSTTKTDYDSLKHAEDFITAVDNSLKDQQFRSKYGTFYVYKYFLNKTRNYAKNRIPKENKKSFNKDVLKTLNKYSFEINFPSKTTTSTKFLFKKILFKSRLKLFIYYNNFTTNKYVKRHVKFMKSLKKGIKSKVKISLYKRLRKLPIKKHAIIFLGFDYSYIGNSKYLFDYILENYSNSNIRFITKSKEVTPDFRVKPNSLRALYYLATYQNLIAESWVPNWIVKRKSTNWIQLWHGTPIKKMLFDSHEFAISNYNPKHKLNKFKDQRRWNYFICESSNIKYIFEESFQLHPRKILSYGYPRVQFLIDNKDNNILKDNIKKKLGITSNNKIVFYAPTWRDYNYKSDTFDDSYYLDVYKLKSLLLPEYTIIFKDHNYLNKGEEVKNVINIKDNIETQELLLISDALISDYSSIVFDFITIEKPFYIYATDEEKYTEFRGLYDEVWSDLSRFRVNTLEELANRIQSDDAIELSKQFEHLKEFYTCKNINYSNKNISNLLI